VRIVAIGAGPAGLYFAILMKKADPAHEVTVLERNRPDDTFGFGVVFSDATLDNFRAADPQTHAEITRAFAHWDDIDIHYQGQVLTSTGHGFAGMSRQRLLDILQRRARDLGARLEFQVEVDDPARWEGADLMLAADGVNSWVRARYAEHFQPAIDWRPNRFVWLGTTCPFPAFTFIFKASEHGLWRVHAYRYERDHSTFILETTEAAWRRAGLDRAGEDDTVAFTEQLFARELGGHPVLKNRSLWRSFPTVKNGRWHHGRIVLVGDAAHTAHFSIGSGTKLAMEDAIALARTLAEQRDVERALDAYEADRRPHVEALQRAAQTSLEWFEQTERYHGRLEPLQFAFSLLTRSLRVSHENLRTRDPRLVASVDRWFADAASRQSGVAVAAAPPPMLTPFRLRELVLANRLVTADLVHLGGRPLGGAGLVMTEPTAVSGDGPGDVTAWKRRVDVVHARPPARIGLRLTAGERPEATREDVVRAARMALEAGFDLLELDLGSRADPRSWLDAFAAARAAWPAARPLAARLSAIEWAEAGREPAAAVELARALKALGCDLVDVAGGSPASDRRLVQTPFSDRVRHEADIATMTGGGLATHADVNAILAAGRADLCALAPDDARAS
jgi:anthraniloyl-CoA monooxygenase